MALQYTSAPFQQVPMPAVDLRRMIAAMVLNEGVRASTDCGVSQAGAGNMSVDIAAGTGLIQDDHASGAGYYWFHNTAPANVTIGAAHATLPRIDRVTIRVRDASLGDAANDVTFLVIAGTPTAGATLVNLNGAAAVPGSHLLLANVLVSAAATQILTANIDTTIATVRPQLDLV
jgi:hypothetical protein